MADTNTFIRRYDVDARSTDTFGRVLCACRQHHFVVDGPVQNGCPGEAVTPAELFLSGVAACGVELLQGIALTLRAEQHARQEEVRERAILRPTRPVAFDLCGYSWQESPGSL